MHANYTLVTDPATLELIADWTEAEIVAAYSTPVPNTYLYTWAYDDETPHFNHIDLASGDSGFFEGADGEEIEITTLADAIPAFEALYLA